MRQKFCFEVWWSLFKIQSPCVIKETWIWKCDSFSPSAVLIRAVRGACLVEIFAQTGPRIKGFSSGILRKQWADPLRVSPRSRSGWLLCCEWKPVGQFVCAQFRTHATHGWVTSVIVCTLKQCTFDFLECRNAAFLFKATFWSPLLHHLNWPKWCSRHFTCKHRWTCADTCFSKATMVILVRHSYLFSALCVHVRKNKLRVACMEKGACVSGGFKSLVQIESGTPHRCSCVYRFVKGSYVIWVN